MIVIGSFLFIQRRQDNIDTINLLSALKNIRRIFVGEWARNTPTMVDPVGYDPTALSLQGIHSPD